MRSFEKSLPEFDARQLRIVAISVDPPEITREHCRKQRYSYTFLSDPKAEVIRKYDLAHEGAGQDGGAVARPAEFLIDSSGTVRWVNLTESLTARARAAQVLKALDALDVPARRGSSALGSGEAASERVPPPS